MKKTILVIVGVLVVLAVLFKVWTRNIPPINDIATDTESLPQFRHIKVKDHGGPEVAAQQVAAYPEIKPLVLQAPLGEVFEKALQMAKDAGWEIVFSDAATGRIEATASTKLWKFQDDVLVLVSLAPEGTRVDVRSQSRVGRSDLGANAKRIKEFLDKLGAP